MPVALASVNSADIEQQWVLQLGYFARLQNALNFKEVLIQTGFDAQTVSTGKPGEQRYLVISGNSASRAGLYDLRNSIEAHTGTKGFVIQSPFENDTAEEVYDQPELRYQVAQASSNMTPDGAQTRISRYDPMLSRTPQQEIDSIPGFTLAGMQIVPTLGLSLGYDDNVTLANRHEISSWFYMISPAIRVEMPSDHSVLALTAGMEFIRYKDSPIDDWEGWFVRGAWVWDISTRQDVNLFVRFSDGTDQRGRGRRQGGAGLIPVPPDEWERWDFGGEWDYGAVGSRGRITLRGGASDLTYKNKHEGILGSRGVKVLDRDWVFYGGIFSWRVAPKTSLLVDYLHTDINYKLADESDSIVESWMVGVTWDATARTSGTVKYGNQTKDFDDPTRLGYDGPTWAASINWRPRTYSAFTLTGTRSTQEPDGGGDYILRQDITLSWLHDWATRFGTTVDVGIGEDDYRPNNRTDDLFYWGIGARYTFNPHFRFGLSVTSYDRDSIVEQFNYSQMIYLLSLEATF